MQNTNWQRVRDILISIVCVGIIVWAAWSVLSQFVYAIVILLLSLAVAFLLTPVVNLLERYAIPRVVAALLVYIVVLAVLGGIGYGLVFSLISQVQYFSTNLPSYVLQLPDTYQAFQGWLVHQGIPQANINAALSQVEAQLQNFATSLVNNALNIVIIVTDAFVNILLVAVLSFYFTLDGKLVRNNVVGIFPTNWKGHIELFEEALNKVVGNYIRGQLTLAFVIGLLAGFGCSVLGLNQFGLIIGVLAFLFETIPMVGPALASIPAILISLLLPDPFPRTFWIMGYFVFIQMFESNVLGPRIVGHAVGLHPIASILALLMGIQVFGAFGALIATPIVAAAWVVIASFYRSARGVTAEEMLAKRRSPWIRRRPPHEGHLRTRKPQVVEGGSGVGKGTTTIAPVRGMSAPGKIEHIDLMRHDVAVEDRQERVEASEERGE